MKKKKGGKNAEHRSSWGKKSELGNELLCDTVGYSCELRAFLGCIVRYNIVCAAEMVLGWWWVKCQRRVLPDETPIVESAFAARFAALPFRKRVPKAERFVACSRDDRLSIWTHREV